MFDAAFQANVVDLESVLQAKKIEQVQHKVDRTFGAVQLIYRIDALLDREGLEKSGLGRALDGNNNGWWEYANTTTYRYDYGVTPMKPEKFDCEQYLNFTPVYHDVIEGDDETDDIVEYKPNLSPVLFNTPEEHLDYKPTYELVTDISED